MNTYTHLGLEDAQNEMVRLEELNKAKEEVAKAAGEQRPVTQRSFRAVYYGRGRTSTLLIVNGLQGAFDDVMADKGDTYIDYCSHLFSLAVK